jgi:phage tail sheath gpL-like
MDVRANYYDGQSNPKGITPTITALAGGSGSPTIGGAWAVLADEQYNHIIQGNTVAADLASLETELDTRYGPQIGLQGFGYTAVRGTMASCATLGLTRNSPHNCIVGANNSPTGPEMWAAAMGAVCAAAMEQDPGRPVHTLPLKGVLPPPSASRFSRSERNTLLYDGISTFTVDAGGNVILERVITTYRVNALNAPDPSYLDINTLFLIMAIRFQFGVRMSNRFLIPRFKLADDSFLVQPGSLVATPKTIKSEIIALFQELYEVGYIENIDDFIKNLVVERDGTDPNRVNTLLAPDLINQFRLLASKLQFIL